MTQLRILLLTFTVVMFSALVASGQTIISVQISGPGALDSSTIKVGKPVSVDIYWENKDADRRGFTTGFKISSETIKNIVHVADTIGVNENGDIKAYNGFGGSDAWDFTGLKTVTVDWEGELPDVVGFGGLRVKQVYNAHENKKVLSWTMVVPEAGEITIDSTFYPPGGVWAIVGKDGKEIPPVWKGPYTFKVVK